MKPIVVLLVGLLPSCKFKNLLLRLLGFEIHRSASIGPIILSGIKELKVGESSRIEFGNVLRNVSVVSVGSSVVIGKFNHFSADRNFLRNTLSSCQLHVGNDAFITNRHYIDCSGGMVLGSYSGIAGTRSTVLSHSLDLTTNLQAAHRVYIGEYTFVGTNVVILPGVKIPGRSVIAAGSLVPSGFSSDKPGIYKGVPVRWTKISAGSWFSRTTGQTTTYFGDLE